MDVINLVTAVALLPIILLLRRVYRTFDDKQAAQENCSRLTSEAGE